MKLVCVTLFVCALALAVDYHQIEGEVVSRDPQATLWAQLTTLNGALISKTPVGLDGRFNFWVPDGNYMVTISDATGRVVSSQPLPLRQMDQRISLSPRDPEIRRQDGPGGKVSVATLRHKPGKAARRAAEAAQKLATRGDHTGAVAAFEKAVALDPQFIEARGDLGAEYLLLHEYAKGESALRQAVALDPSAAWLQSNLAFALYQMQRLDEALQVARTAVALDSRNVKARYLFGWLLLRTEPAEGLRQLERVAEEVPRAYRILADYYRSTGDIAMARREIERYLATDPSGHQAEVAAWVASLQ